MTSNISMDNHEVAEFESCLEQLERIVAQMGQGELSLEHSVRHFEQGMALIQHCEKQLKSAEQRVKVLLEDGRPSDIEPSSLPR